MHNRLHAHVDAFIAKLETRERLEEGEREAIRALPQKLVRLEQHAQVVTEGQRPTHCCMVAEGMAFRSKLSQGGRRQILSFHVPGDMVDLQTLLFKIADHSIETTRNAAIVLIPHEAVMSLVNEFPTLGRAFWFDTLVDSAIQRETLLNVGRRDARARTAHLLCEIVARLRRIGRAGDGQVVLPLTQVDLADALGITPIHVNRVLARLRGEGLIALETRTLTVRDWAGLAAAGEFDDAYLHFEGPAEPHR